MVESAPASAELHLNPDDDDSEDEIPLLSDLDAIQNTTENTRDQAELPPVPVTILTGFLGSGKTTLVRNILTSHQHQKRIAVIENEFCGGESDVQLADRMGLTVNDLSTLSVETMIAKDGTDGSNLADFIELSNGCVCCTVKDSLVQTLESLLAKRSDLDYVIIEASGMADPGPVASIFWLDEELGSRIQLDGIVTCVDAKNILSQLEATASSPAPIIEVEQENSSSDGGDEAARQIAFADRILVNKIDLLQSQNNLNDFQAALEMVLQKITSINPTAPVLKTTYSKVEDLNWILDAKCFDAGRIKDVESAFEQSTMNSAGNSLCNDDNKCDNLRCTGNHALSSEFCGLCCDPSTQHNILGNPTAPENNHRHTGAVGTIALFGIGSIDLHKFNTWLASVLWPDQDEMDKVLRARLEENLKLSRGKESKVTRPSDKGKQKIYRIKGIISVTHALDPAGNVVPTSNDWVDDGLLCDLIDKNNGLDRRRFIVQAVNDLWEVLPVSENLCWDLNETRCCKIVVIGKWLHERKLKEGFNNCFIKK